MSNNFILDPQFEKDSYFICRLGLSQIRLKNIIHFPWVILIPEKSGLDELFELSNEDQYKLIEEISCMSALMKDYFVADKMNVAAFGNQVSQLHIHIIARKKGDAAWPNNPWACSQTEGYSENDIQQLVPSLRTLFTQG